MISYWEQLGVEHINPAAKLLHLVYVVYKLICAFKDSLAFRTSHPFHYSEEKQILIWPLQDDVIKPGV